MHWDQYIGRKFSSTLIIIDREKINKQIDSVYAPVSGGTPLGQYIKIGVDKLLEVRQKEKLCVIEFLKIVTVDIYAFIPMT